jgi:hypothetical protein
MNSEKGYSMKLNELEVYNDKPELHQGKLLDSGFYECGCCSTSFTHLEPGYYYIDTDVDLVVYETKGYWRIRIK